MAGDLSSIRLRPQAMLSLVRWSRDYHDNPLQIVHHTHLDFRRGVSINHRSMSSVNNIWWDTHSANCHTSWSTTKHHRNPRTSSWSTIFNQNTTQIPLTSSRKNGCSTRSAAKYNQISVAIAIAMEGMYSHNILRCPLVVVGFVVQHRPSSK